MATDKKPKRERLVSPLGICYWAHVHNPKAPYEDKGKPQYMIDVRFEKDDPEWKKWASDVMAKIRAMPQQFDKKKRDTEGNPVKIEKQIPIKPVLDQDDNPTTMFFVTFKTSEDYPPSVLDKYGRIIPKETLIGNGSKVRVNYSPNEYDGFGGGMNFYLNGVQVVELVEYRAQTAESLGFPTEEAPTGEEPAAPGGEEPETKGPEGDDNIPFRRRFVSQRRGHLHHRQRSRFRIV